MKLLDLHESAQSDADLLMLLFTTLGDGKLKKGKILTALEEMDGERRTAILEQSIHFARMEDGSSIGSVINDLLLAQRSLETVAHNIRRVEKRAAATNPVFTHPIIKDLMAVLELSKRIAANEDDLAVVSLVTNRLQMYQDELRSGDIGTVLIIDETDVAFIEATFKKLGML